MKNRCDIDKKYTWDLDVIYSDMNSFDKDYDCLLYTSPSPRD